ncbi:MAG TPA: 4-hydroxy-3-methylbut-2-enyl diphosphate reductase [Bacteroidales bacterium]|nr:4-hydroxy-3-methylbut-2-enyl diphosphate reductase [Bacteroidales bacterium]
MQVTIDPGSGFCFGVQRAVETAERELKDRSSLPCLGDIVHNEREVKRLSELGLSTISADALDQIHDSPVLIRAHGEPPEIYRKAALLGIDLVDATCPIVLRLQEKVREAAEELKAKNGQVVIFGKEGHAEVKALCGHANGLAIVVGPSGDLSGIDFTRPVRIFSQTTMNRHDFQAVAARIRKEMEGNAGVPLPDFRAFDTVCGQVSSRSARLKEFATSFDVIIFVSGKESSNGRILFETCRSVNPRTYLVSGALDLDNVWFEHARNAGVCGATSTPKWLMQEVADRIEEIDG